MLAAITIVIMIVLSWTLGTCVEVPEWLENGYGITFHCEDGKAPLLKQPALASQAFMGQPCGVMCEVMLHLCCVQGALTIWPQHTWHSLTGPSAISSPLAA